MTTAPMAKRLRSEKAERPPGSYGSGNTKGGVRRRGASAYAGGKRSARAVARSATASRRRGAT
jgi:hypothetical protein